MSSIKTGLILAGGGARNAYQVGVLKAVADILPSKNQIPFDVVSGTSAGALNAGVLACHADEFAHAVDLLDEIWGNLHIEQVFNPEQVSNFSAAGKLIWRLVRARNVEQQPHSILDNHPLQGLVEQHIDPQRIAQHIDSGALRALGINTSSYTSGKSITYFMGHADIAPWDRTKRRGVRDNISYKHLMASAAIPLIFPAVQIRDDYHGDGSMRQWAPLSPALHMGANRILVVSVGNTLNEHDAPDTGPKPYPSLGQIGGYIFESLFLETLDADIERVRRYNAMLKSVPGQHVDIDGMRIEPVETLVISPSGDVRSLVEKHMSRFPHNMNLILRVLGASRPEGRQISSYLLFEKEFCRELMDMGYQDAHARKDEIVELLGFNATLQRAS